MNAARALATTAGVTTPRLRVKPRLGSVTVANPCVTVARRDAVMFAGRFVHPFASSSQRMRERKGLVVRATSKDDDTDSTTTITNTPLDIDALVTELTDFTKIGKRDEAYFVGQMVLLFCLAFPPAGGELSKADLGLSPSAFDPVIGSSLLLLSIVFVFRGITDLGNSLTPFPKPREDNELVTNGAYAVTRHPMYSGLIFGSCGVALVTGSPVRTVLAACLAALLYFKSQKEEEYLTQKHGEQYAAYQGKTPRLVPNVAGIGELLETTFGSLRREKED